MLGSLVQFWIPAKEAAGGADWVMWLIILGVVVAGAGFVFWSRKKGAGEESGRDAPPTVEEKPFLVPEGKTLREGMERTRKEGFVARLAGVFRKELDADLEAEVEEVLLSTAVRLRTANNLVN